MRGIAGQVIHLLRVGQRVRQKDIRLRCGDGAPVDSKIPIQSVTIRPHTGPPRPSPAFAIHELNPDRKVIGLRQSLVIQFNSGF